MNSTLYLRTLREAGSNFFGTLRDSEEDRIRFQDLARNAVRGVRREIQLNHEYPISRFDLGGTGYLLQEMSEVIGLRNNTRWPEGLQRVKDAFFNSDYSTREDEIEGQDKAYKEVKYILWDIGRYLEDDKGSTDLRDHAIRAAKLRLRMYVVIRSRDRTRWQESLTGYEFPFFEEMRDSRQEKIDAEDMGLHAIISIRAEIGRSFNGDELPESEALRAQADALIDRMRPVVDARSAMCNELNQAAESQPTIRKLLTNSKPSHLSLLSDVFGTPLANRGEQGGLNGMDFVDTVLDAGFSVCLIYCGWVILFKFYYAVR